MAKAKTDFTFQNHGSLCLLTPLSDAACNWAEEHIGDAETQTWCGGIVIEPRYVQPILEAIDAEGFTRG